MFCIWYAQGVIQIYMNDFFVYKNLLADKQTDL